MHDAQTGYGSARASTASPRAVERAILRRLAGAIEGAADYPTLAAAVHRNTEFWTALAVDLAGPGNGLPEALRGQLLSLAGFAVRHGASVLKGEADEAALVAVNRTIADGLDQAALSDAA